MSKIEEVINATKLLNNLEEELKEYCEIKNDNGEIKLLLKQLPKDMDYKFFTFYKIDNVPVPVICEKPEECRLCILSSKITSLDNLPEKLKQLSINHCHDLKDLKGNVKMVHILNLYECEHLYSLEGCPQIRDEIAIRDCPNLKKVSYLRQTLSGHIYFEGYSEFNENGYHKRWYLDSPNGIDNVIDFEEIIDGE